MIRVLIFVNVENNYLSLVANCCEALFLCSTPLQPFFNRLLSSEMAWNILISNFSLKKEKLDWNEGILRPKLRLNRKSGPYPENVTLAHGGVSWYVKYWTQLLSSTDSISEETYHLTRMVVDVLLSQPHRNLHTICVRTFEFYFN